VTAEPAVPEVRHRENPARRIGNYRDPLGQSGGGRFGGVHGGCTGLTSFLPLGARIPAHAPRGRDRLP